MPVHRGNIGEVLLSAWNDALCKPVECADRKTPNRQRSRNWVDALAKQFRRHYPRERYRVFWSGNKDNQEDFGLNELLFDPAVCSVSATDSLQRKARPLPYIARCHWQIESKFSLQNTRDLIVDMSKLVMGAADNKLMVAAHRGDRGERDGPRTVRADRGVLRRAGVFLLRVPPGRLGAEAANSSDAP